jgi:hypothetical protein
VLDVSDSPSSPRFRPSRIAGSVSGIMWSRDAARAWPPVRRFWMCEVCGFESDSLDGRGRRSARPPRPAGTDQQRKSHDHKVDAEEHP